MKNQIEFITLYFKIGERVSYLAPDQIKTLYGRIEAPINGREGWYYVRHQSGELSMQFWQWLCKMSN